MATHPVCGTRHENRDLLNDASGCPTLAPFRVPVGTLETPEQEVESCTVLFWSFLSFWGAHSTFFHQNTGNSTWGWKAERVVNYWARFHLVVYPFRRHDAVSNEDGTGSDFALDLFD